MMRIEQLDLYLVEMPLISPWRTAYGEDASSFSILVRAIGEGREGWSESAPLGAPTYLPESAGAAFYHASEIFASHVVGRDYATARDLNSRLAVFKGNGFAKAAVEMSWWTLECALRGVPLHTLLGGPLREVPVGAAFGIEDSIDALLRKIGDARAAGHPCVKLKVAHGWDLEIVRAATSTFPGMQFHIDCNAGYTLDDLPFFKAIDGLGLAFIEQPLHYADVIDHAELARQIRTPVCLDESIVSVKSAEQAIKVGACSVINIKPARVGGLASAVAIHDMARNAGIACWVGAMFEGGIGTAIGVELATLPGFTHAADLTPPSVFLAADVADRPVELTPRMTFLPTRGALPAPDPAALARLTRASKTVRPP
ncbi:MAG: o-succinylbenzoate synthase [SAR202 cluster bacterium]|nr:o-succinylbenzoate synthase [SAR202 cluster bacterium]